MGSQLVSFTSHDILERLNLTDMSGFHATTAEEYAQGFQKALSLAPKEKLAMRRRARKSAKRFTDRQFAEKWLTNMDKLVELYVERTQKQGMSG